jgi:hypothetical protein
MNSDKKENKGQDDQNFQNEDRDSKANQKASSPAVHPITGNAEPDYADDLSNDKSSSESDTKTPAGQNQQKSKISSSDSQSSDPDSKPYDSENLDQESGSTSKDITEKDIEKDLIENDPSEGFETAIDIQKSNEAESKPFEILEPQEDNPVKKEFEIGQLGNHELREDERARDESGNGAPGHEKPSQRKF